MRCGSWLFGSMLCLAGCVSLGEERVQDYNEDGVHLFLQGKYADARDSFQAALALKADDPGIVFNLGECYDKLGDSARAEKYYRECIARVPNHEPCRHALADLLVRANRRPEAVQLVQDWLAGEPARAAAYADDGWLAHQGGDLPRAQARLQQALELDPHDPRALTELAQVYEEMQRPDRALVLYERVLERDPKQADVSAHINFLLAKGVKRPHPE